MKIFKKIIECSLVFAWMMSLYGTRAVYQSYVIIALLGMLAISQNLLLIEKKEIRKYPPLYIGGILSLCIMVGNYNLFQGLPVAVCVLRIVVMFVGGTVCLCEIFSFAYQKLTNLVMSEADVYDRKKQKRIGTGSGLLVFLFHTLYLFFCAYPAGLNYDTLRQLSEISSGEYTNHHPILLTALLKVCIEGMEKIGLDISAGIFVFTLIHIVFISVIVGYTMYTLCEMRVPWYVLLAFVCFFLIYPMNICFITYAQKDGIFAYLVLLLIVSIYRWSSDIGNRKWNLVLITVSAFLVSILRSNGFLMVVITALVAVFVQLPHKRKLLLSFGVVAVLVVCYKTLFLNAIGVEKTEFSEGLSIPIQQIGRVVYDQLPLTDDEEAMISELIDMNSVRYTNPYNPHCSDNIKGLIQFGQKDSYLQQHKKEYLKLWITLGFRYPKEYIEAYVDETYGYVIPGVGDCSFQHYELVNAKDFGVQASIRSPRLEKLINGYIRLFETRYPLSFLTENGLALYVMIICACICLWKRKSGVLLTIPSFAGVLTLLVSTPLSGNQRYTLYMFVTLPFVLVVAFCGESGTSNKG